MREGVGENYKIMSFIICLPLRCIVMVIKSWLIRWVGHVVRVGQMRSAENTLIDKAEGARLLGNLRRRCRIVGY
jgi:hypothetical protein